MNFPPIYSIISIYDIICVLSMELEIFPLILPITWTNRWILKTKFSFFFILEVKQIFNYKDEIDVQ